MRIIPHPYPLLKQMHNPAGHHRPLYVYGSCHFVVSHRFLLHRAAYSHFVKYEEKTDSLQCSGSEFPRTQRSRAAVVVDDYAYRLHLAVLCEFLKQIRYYSTEAALVSEVLPARIDSKKLAPLHADHDRYIFWVKDVKASFQAL